MKQWTLILGGARSGKSSFAQEQVIRKKQASTIYLASAVAFDGEMKDRIKRHQQDRPAEWQTVEAPYDAHDPIRQLGQEKGIILWDCLTFYLNNLIYQETEIKNNGTSDLAKIEQLVLEEVDRIIALKDKTQCDLTVVSNEVGNGVVPENELGRLFRDIAGRANQKFAQACDRVYLVTAGISTKLK